MMKFLIFGNQYKPALTDAMHRLIERLESEDVEILFEHNYLTHILSAGDTKARRFRPFDTIPPDADLAISMGGDGTFLLTADAIADRGIPILGINRGRLGFLTDVSETELDTLYDTLRHHRYTIEQRTVLRVAAQVDGNPLTRYALNEIAILKQDLSSMITIEARIGDTPLNTYQADGLIVSTPTGSTAYSLSVGGPIMMPENRNLIIAPVASHSLNVRPLVIPDTWTLTLSVSSRSHSYLLSADGRSLVLPHTVTLTVDRAPHTLRTIRLHTHTFLDTLRQKLYWGIDPRSK